LIPCHCVNSWIWSLATVLIPGFLSLTMVLNPGFDQSLAMVLNPGFDPCLYGLHEYPACMLQWLPGSVCPQLICTRFGLVYRSCIIFCSPCMKTGRKTCVEGSDNWEE
jgi:hypothetical protein